MALGDDEHFLVRDHPSVWTFLFSGGLCFCFVFLPGGGGGGVLT